MQRPAEYSRGRMTMAFKNIDGGRPVPYERLGVGISIRHQTLAIFDIRVRLNGLSKKKIKNNHRNSTWAPAVIEITPLKHRRTIVYDAQTLP